MQTYGLSGNALKVIAFVAMTINYPFAFFLNRQVILDSCNTL